MTRRGASRGGRRGLPAGQGRLVEIVRAGPDFDRWAELHALLVRAFAYMDGRIDPPSSLTRMSTDDLRRKSASETLILAEVAARHGSRATHPDAARLVGCAFADIRRDHVYLGKVAIDAAFRGRGLLQRIIADVDALARERGTAWIELQTRVELKENHRSFAAVGFAKVGETCHPGFSRPTSVTMRRSVPAGPAGLSSGHVPGAIRDVVAKMLDMRDDRRDRPAPHGHNAGPELDDHITKWPTGRLREFIAWKAAHARAFKPVSNEVAIRRARQAARCGVTYEEYTSFLLDTGRHLQPGDTDAIAGIKARRTQRWALPRCPREHDDLTDSTSSCSSSR